eukprot:13243517-Alexandrium_andersonii.AAC.1
MPTVGASNGQARARWPSGRARSHPSPTLRPWSPREIGPEGPPALLAPMGVAGHEQMLELLAQLDLL